MITVKCAGCSTRIKGADVYYRPSDDRPVCERCHSQPDRGSQRPGLDGLFYSRSSADSGPDYDSSD